MRADLGAPPLPVDGDVDAILSTATLHWVLDHDRLFEGLAGVLRSGGQLSVRGELLIAEADALFVETLARGEAGRETGEPSLVFERRRVAAAQQLAQRTISLRASSQSRRSFRSAGTGPAIVAFFDVRSMSTFRIAAANRAK